MCSRGLAASVPSIAIRGRAAVARGPRPKGAAGSSVPLPATWRFPHEAAWRRETAKGAQRTGFESQLCQLLAEWTWLSHFVDLSIPICKMGFH